MLRLYMRSDAGESAFYRGSVMVTTLNPPAGISTGIVRVSWVWPERLM